MDRESLARVAELLERIRPTAACWRTCPDEDATLLKAVANVYHPDRVRTAAEGEGRRQAAQGGAVSGTTVCCTTRGSKLAAQAGVHHAELFSAGGRAG